MNIFLGVHCWGSDYQQVVTNAPSEGAYSFVGGSAGSNMVCAIAADTNYEESDKDKWLLLHKKFSAIWPNITKKKEPMIDHEKFKDTKDKHSKYFSENPGK